MMKKIIAGFVTIFLSLSILAACGNPANAEVSAAVKDSKKTTTEKTKPPDAFNKV